MLLQWLTRYVLTPWFSYTSFNNWLCLQGDIGWIMVGIFGQLFGPIFFLEYIFLIIDIAKGNPTGHHTIHQFNLFHFMLFMFLLVLTVGFVLASDGFKGAEVDEKQTFPKFKYITDVLIEVAESFIAISLNLTLT